MANKNVRQTIFDKYNGHCAYCGCELRIEDMQIDHINPKYRSMINGKPIDNSVENLNPSCRQCNFYKGTNDIAGFRKRIFNQLQRTCVDSFQSRLAMKYGIIKHNEWCGKFYFEKL
ncbi:MAG: HNH endonuclease [Bacteroidales bacterium]|nr:HNH endonuclease [Bacteroidales bacterium]